MVKAEEFKGIEYVRISSLPSDQAEQIRGNSAVKKITILKDEKLMRDCITYKEYKTWYENHYQPSGAVSSALATEKSNGKVPKRSFSFNIMRYFFTLVEKN